MTQDRLPASFAALARTGVRKPWRISTMAFLSPARPLLRPWLRPHRGLSQEKLPLYLGFFQFVHNARRRGKALLGALVAALVA